VGRVLHRVDRHGKYLVLTFDDPGPARVMLHLRMTGQVFVLDGYRPDQHVHLSLDFEGLPVHYRDIRKFGRWTVVGADWRARELGHVGPDMLQVRFPAWHEAVRRRRAPVKAVLLDQGVAAGLGNIYVDEALFRAGVHPLTPPAALDRAALHAVLRAARGVLRLAIDHGGTTFLNFTDFHGQPGNFRRKLRVYGRTGEACRRCGTAIERLVVAGRSTHLCPRCQPRVR
jgi:formamidopyrimidine-DNA glycosylase